MTELRLQDQGLDWREVDSEVIALERERSVYLAANRSATLLWRALAEGSSEQGLADLLVDAYGIEPEAARADAAGFVAEMRARGLLETR